MTMYDKKLTPKELEALTDKSWEAAHFAMNTLHQLEVLLCAMHEQVNKQDKALKEQPSIAAPGIRELHHLVSIGRNICQDIGNHLDCECETVHNERSSRRYSDISKDMGCL